MSPVCDDVLAVRPSGERCNSDVASVSGLDVSSVPAALWTAEAHPGAHACSQTQVGPSTLSSNLDFSIKSLETFFRFINRWLLEINKVLLEILQHYCYVFDDPNRGDYRTGKRLNMRKVIPYIASQFRKDKIWLRRTKPSKRNYQICLAVDDSSSMVDNHTKQVQ